MPPEEMARSVLRWPCALSSPSHSHVLFPLGSRPAVPRSGEKEACALTDSAGMRSRSKGEHFLPGRGEGNS